MPEEVDTLPTAWSDLPAPSPAADNKSEATAQDQAQSEPIEMLDDDDEDDVKPKPEHLDAVQVAQAKVRYEADLKKHHYVPPVAARLQDDWQVAYVWAFIVKFQQINHIRKLECLEDFERCLTQPVANRPDDIFEGVLIRFLANLKPGIRNLNCTNIQSHLSNYITDQLLSSPEFTVWDRPWAPNEEARGSCCTDAPDRQEWGRLRYPGEPIADRARKNPIFQAEERGGGLFELSWIERAKLLRQLVDWQLTHAEGIRGIIHKEYKFSDAKTKAIEGLSTSIQAAPIGLDRDKKRIWAFDASGRIYQSGNPFKRPCPLETVTSNRTQVLEYQEKLKIYSSEPPRKPEGSGPKGKMTAGEVAKYKKLVKGVEDEKALVGEIEKLLPDMEKEEARVQRARKRIAATVQASQLAELRSTRTRRPTRQVNYAYTDEISDDEIDTRRGGKRQKNESATWEGSSTRGKLVIPGERRSARHSMKDDTPAAASSLVQPPASVISDHSNRTTTTTTPSTANGTSSNDESVEAAKKKRNKMKGWAWVEEPVPPKEPENLAAQGQNGHGANGEGGLDGEETPGEMTPPPDRDASVVDASREASEGTAGRASSPNGGIGQAMEIDA